MRDKSPLCAMGTQNFPKMSVGQFYRHSASTVEWYTRVKENVLWAFGHCQACIHVSFQWGGVWAEWLPYQCSKWEGKSGEEIMLFL